MERLTVFDRDFDRYKVNISGHCIYTEPGIKTQGGVALNGCLSWLMGEAVERLAQYENERFGERRPESAPGCIWMQDEICVNPDFPMRADFCPVPNDEGVCRYEERRTNV